MCTCASVNFDCLTKSACIQFFLILYAPVKRIFKQPCCKRPIGSTCQLITSGLRQTQVSHVVLCRPSATYKLEILCVFRIAPAVGEKLLPKLVAAFCGTHKVTLPCIRNFCARNVVLLKFLLTYPKRCMHVFTWLWTCYVTITYRVYSWRRRIKIVLDF